MITIQKPNSPKAYAAFLRLIRPVFLPHKGEAHITITTLGETERYQFQWEDVNAPQSVVDFSRALSEAETEEERAHADDSLSAKPVRAAILERHVMSCVGTPERDIVVLLRQKNRPLTLERALVELDQQGSSYSKTALGNACVSLRNLGVIYNHGSGYGLARWED